MSKRRLYLIGIDSAPLQLTRQFSRKHRLKGFNEIIKNGSLTSLKSTLPPITAAAWPSIYTGLSPAEHGVMNFFYLDKEYNKQLTFYNSNKNPPFWDVLAKEGKRCLVITPAMATEPSRTSGVDMITGFPLKPKFSSVEIEKASEKLGFIGEPEIEQALKEGQMSFEEATKRYVESIRKRSEVSKHLIERNDYDLAFICFTETDRIQHYALSLKNSEEHILPLYAEISDFINWIVARAEEKGEEFAIMLVSDHGAQPIKKKILLNTWLIRNGYASLDSVISSSGLKVDISQSKKLSSAEGLREEKYHEQLRISTKSPVTRFICASEVETSYEDYSYKRSFDMKNTKAFASLSNNPVSSIWINDSRFAEPGIQGHSKEKLIQEIKIKMLELKDGEINVVSKVYSGNEYYGDTKLFIPPDLIVEASPGYTMDVFNHSEESVFAEPEAARSGDHTREGIFGFYSNSSKAEQKDLCVEDIYQMVLAYFGGTINKMAKPGGYDVI